MVCFQILTPCPMHKGILQTLTPGNDALPVTEQDTSFLICERVIVATSDR